MALGPGTSTFKGLGHQVRRAKVTRDAASLVTVHGVSYRIISYHIVSYS